MASEKINKNKKQSNTGIYIGSGLLVFTLLVIASKKKAVVAVKPKSKDKLNIRRMTKEEFTKFLSPSVKVIADKTGIPYKFMMAQMALETGWGKSELFWKYFNVGGIRAFPDKRPNEPYTLAWTHEVVLPSELPKWDKYERNKAKDVKVIKNGKEYVNISVKLPFRTFPGLVEGLKYYLDKVLLNKYFKNYIAEANGNAEKYVDLLQSGKYGAKYATSLSYPQVIKDLMRNFA